MTMVGEVSRPNHPYRRSAAVAVAAAVVVAVAVAAVAFGGP
ncbi:MAG: hypothetical protein ABJH63_11150 [Rhizobiaceae bacterium]